MTDIRAPQLGDPRQAAGHLDLLVSPRHYRQRTLFVVTADRHCRPVHHIEVVDCTPDASASECATVLDNLVGALASGPDGSVSIPHCLLLAVTRPGGEAVQSTDQAWFRAFHRVCHARGIRPLGVYIVGVHGTRAITVDDAA